MVPSFLLSHLQSDHAKAVKEPSFAVVLPSRRLGKAIAGAAGGPCTPTGQPCFPAALLRTHPHQINACPLILVGLLSHSSKHRYSYRKQHPKRGTAAPERSAPPWLCSAGKDPPGHEDEPGCGGGNSSASKTYLSTQRRSRVEVVGYPQHPQNSETQEYPGFPPHGCRLRSPPAVDLFRGSAIRVRLTRSPVSALSCDVPIRQVSSVGPRERREGAGSSQPTSARLEGKG